MGYVLDHSFLPERYFEMICAIPHGSYHEKPLSDYLVQFAKERGLRYKQYPNWNVIIYKDAYPGYEDHEPVMLQAHIDMVCEKEPGYKHDFEKDPLSLYVEDEKLYAHGTTLGADDGVGVAYMLAFLEDDTIPHPPLECVFTVQEEVGLIGAKELAFEDITARRMIGLDDMGGDTSYVSSCGSQYISLARKLAFEDNTESGYKISISGLLGGHSGVCINKERGNAIKLMGRMLYGLTKQFDIRIGDICGGGKDNVIPSACDAIIACDAAFDELEAAAATIAAEFKSELAFSDPDIQVAVAMNDCPKSMNAKDSAELIQCLFLLPDGFRHKSMKITNLTTVSENLANITIDDGTLRIRYLARSEMESFLDLMHDELVLFCKIYGFSMEASEKSPGWQFDDQSKIRKILFDSYYAVTGSHMTMIAEHGGLETGYISGGLPGIDIVTCGPRCEGYHTTKECLDLRSFRRVYEVLKHALKSM